MPKLNRNTISVTLAVVLAAGSSVYIASRPSSARPAPARAEQRITEDDPRWDCRTMGNKICGPDAPKPVYYCGAPTKKGTACKRRVKAAGERCWQHKGVK